MNGCDAHKPLAEVPLVFHFETAHGHSLSGEGVLPVAEWRRKGTAMNT